MILAVPAFAVAAQHSGSGVQPSTSGKNTTLADGATPGVTNTDIPAVLPTDGAGTSAAATTRAGSTGQVVAPVDPANPLSPVGVRTTTPVTVHTTTKTSPTKKPTKPPTKTTKPTKPPTTDPAPPTTDPAPPTTDPAPPTTDPPTDPGTT